MLPQLGQKSNVLLEWQLLKPSDGLMVGSLQLCHSLLLSSTVKSPGKNEYPDISPQGEIQIN